MNPEFFTVPAFTTSFHYKNFEFVFDYYLGFTNAQVCDLKAVLYKGENIHKVIDNKLVEINKELNVDFGKDELFRYLIKLCNDKMFVN